MSKKKEEYTGEGIATTVKTLVEKPSQEIRSRINTLKTIIDDSYFEMAGVLYNVYNKKLFLDWGYRDFENYVNNELDFSLRKAQYLIQIWYYFGVELGDETVLAKISGLGWSKVKELCNVVTIGNVDDWVEKAAKLSAIEIKALAREALEKSVDGSGGEAESLVKERTFSRTFKFGEEQNKTVNEALLQAGEIGRSDIPSRQLELIALNYLSNTDTKKTKGETISSYFKSLGDSHGVDLVVIDKDTSDIILGRELIMEDEPEPEVYE